MKANKAYTLRRMNEGNRVLVETMLKGIESSSGAIWCYGF